MHVYIHIRIWISRRIRIKNLTIKKCTPWGANFLCWSLTPSNRYIYIQINIQCMYINICMYPPTQSNLVFHPNWFNIYVQPKWRGCQKYHEFFWNICAKRWHKRDMARVHDYKCSRDELTLSRKHTGLIYLHTHICIYMNISTHIYLYTYTYIFISIFI